MKHNLGCLYVAILLLSATAHNAKADQKSLLQYEKPNLDRIAQLTAKEHSTILFTLADHFTGFAIDGKVQMIDTNSSRNCQYPHPALSHDGLRIAFVSDGDSEEHCRIAIYDIATGVRRDLVGTIGDPGEIAWSWDDSEIAALNGGLLLISISNAKEEVLTLPLQDEEGHRVLHWIWSPIAWLHDDKGLIVQFDADIPTKTPDTTTSQPEMFVVRDGGAREIWIGSYPAVSPSSDQVAYFTRDGIRSIHPDGTGNAVLWKEHGVYAFLITHLPNLSSEGWFPIVWSPDESRLLYHEWVSEDYRDSIFLLDVKSGRSKSFLSRTSIRIKGWRQSPSCWGIVANPSVPER